MISDGFQPDFPTGSEQQVEEIRADGHAARPGEESGRGYYGEASCGVTLLHTDPQHVFIDFGRAR